MPSLFLRLAFFPPFFFPLVAALIRSRALHTKRCIRRPRLVMSQPRPHCPFLSNCGFSTSSLPPLQRCQCHRCFVSPLSESCRSRSGTSMRRVLSWLPSTRLSIPAGHGTPTSSASSTGPCWSERRRGTPARTPSTIRYFSPPLPQVPKLQMRISSLSWDHSSDITVHMHDIRTPALTSC